MKIIYFHGFASQGNSEKSRALRDFFGDENVLSPDLPINPLEVVNLIDDLVRENRDEQLFLVGTSLGGFYAWWASQRWDIPCMLVNPSTRPSSTIGNNPGTFKNHATGEDFQVLPEFKDLWSFMEYEAKTNQNGANINMALAADDAVIPFSRAIVDIPYTNDTVITPDGGHRYTDRWADVVTKVAQITK